jgi:hypothetical protein
MHRIRLRLAEWLATPGGGRLARDLAFLGALFLFVWVAYGPSLRHPPRADQWCFLVDTRDDRTFLDTIRHTYSYNRTRTVRPGDTDLFRPVLFALLSAEKCAFAGHLAQTQAVGIALHCAVCALMLALVRQAAGFARPAPEGERRDGDWLAYATVAFFALNPCTQELVIWSHLHGYLLFLLLIFGSANCLLRFARATLNGRPAGAWFAAGWLLALVSAFTYELGQVYATLAGCLVAAAVLPRAGWGRAAALAACFAAVAGLYQAANRIDLEVHRGNYEPDNYEGGLLRNAFGPWTPYHAPRYVLYTTAQPFFPSLVQAFEGDQRLQVAESLWTGRRLRVLTPALVLSYCAAGLALALAGAGAWRLARDRGRLALAALALFAGLYASYSAVIVLGRMNLRPGVTILSGNSYYAYPALAFALLTASACWHAAGARAWRARAALAACLALLTVPGAELVWQANTNLAKEEQEWSQPIRAVQRFVDDRGGEPGFGFEIDYAASDAVPEVYGRKITDLVFARWVTSASPRYRVAIRDGVARPVPIESVNSR